MVLKKNTVKITGQITAEKAVIGTGNRPVWPYPNIVTMSWKDAQKRWRWTHKGKDYYFTGTPDEALTEWQRRSKAIYNPGAEPAPETDPQLVTVETLINRWLADKEAQKDRGAITQKTYDGYLHIGDKLADYLGEKRTVSSLTPDDFARVMKKHDVGVYRLRNFVVTCRSIFRWGVDVAHLIERQPAYGLVFSPPTDKQFRQHRAKIGRRDFEGRDVVAMLRVTHKSPFWHALVWLSINSAMSHADMIELPWSAINGQELRWYRVKTAFRRVCWLWPETVRALAALPRTPRQVLVFPQIKSNRITHDWRVVFDLAGVPDYHAQYDFRRTFITLAAKSRDMEARKLAVGHRLGNVDDAYIQTFPINRVRSVARIVRDWLLAAREDQARARRGAATVEGAGPDAQAPAPAK